MKRLKFFGPIVVIAAAALAWMLFLSEPGARWLANLLGPKSKIALPVGRLVQTQGVVKSLRHGEVREITASIQSPIEILDGDQLEVSKNGRALIILNSKDEFELGSLSSANLQLWNMNDAASAVYLNWLSGTLEHRKPGIKGKAYVVHEGRLYLPGQRPGKKALALTLSQNNLSDLKVAQTVHGDTDDFEDDTSTDEDESTPAENTSEYGALPDTLSNEYIDEMMASRQSQFQKCWLPRLKENPELKGQIVLQFEISKRGKVRDLRVTDSNIKDETLRNCVMQVVERLPFRAFKGPEISLSYPLSFE